MKMHCVVYRQGKGITVKRKGNRKVTLGPPEGSQKKEKGQVICRGFCKFLSAMNGGRRKEGREVGDQMTFSSMTNNSGRTSNASATLAPNGAPSVKKTILQPSLFSYSLHNGSSRFLRNNGANFNTL